jgi:hypothetical protein
MYPIAFGARVWRFRARGVGLGDPATDPALDMTVIVH